MLNNKSGRSRLKRNPPVWLVDWSDSEHEDFIWACQKAGIEARVLRGAVGGKIGRPLHSTRCLLAQAWLALRGMREADGAPIITWQPVIGALIGLLVPRRRSRLIVLNPLISANPASFRQRTMARGLARADRILFFSLATLEDGVSIGLPRRRLRFVPLGARVTAKWSPPTDDYFLAIGREERDWATLEKAAEGLDCEIRVIGPAYLPESGPLRLLPQVERTQLLELMKGARAIVVPLNPTARPAGQLTVVDGMSVGRAVIATRAPGVEDYVRPEAGILVPPGDVQALREALLRLCDRVLSERMGAAALAAAHSQFSIERFLADVDSEARSS